MAGTFVWNAALTLWPAAIVVKLCVAFAGINPSKVSLRVALPALVAPEFLIDALTVTCCCGSTGVIWLCVAVRTAGLGNTPAQSPLTAAITPKPGCPGSGPYAGLASTFKTAPQEILPKMSLPCFTMAVETMTSMKLGRVEGGLPLLPGLACQQPWVKVVMVALGWHCWMELTGLARPLNELLAEKFPEVTCLLHWAPQKFTSVPIFNPPLFPPQITKDV